MNVADRTACDRPTVAGENEPFVCVPMIAAGVTVIVAPGLAVVDQATVNDPEAALGLPADGLGGVIV